MSASSFFPLLSPFLFSLSLFFGSGQASVGARQRRRSGGARRERRSSGRRRGGGGGDDAGAGEGRRRRRGEQGGKGEKAAARRPSPPPLLSPPCAWMRRDLADDVAGDLAEPPGVREQAAFSRAVVGDADAGEDRRQIHLRRHQPIHRPAEQAEVGRHEAACEVTTGDEELERRADRRVVERVVAPPRLQHVAVWFGRRRPHAWESPTAAPSMYRSLLGASTPPPEQRTPPSFFLTPHTREPPAPRVEMEALRKPASMAPPRGPRHRMAEVFVSMVQVKSSLEMREANAIIVWPAP
uniref:Uncharacterized protein n=1 Tax=Oryza glumipatula TaxID=40148 RepID=A0A0D9Z8V7_9ORYZ